MIDQFRLDPDEQKRLRGMDQSITILRETIKKMKAIGMPVEEQEERLENAVRMRDGFLREFGSPVVPR